jgi:hypothetical protein
MVTIEPLRVATYLPRRFMGEVRNWAWPGPKKVNFTGRRTALKLSVWVPFPYSVSVVPSWQPGSEC